MTNSSFHVATASSTSPIEQRTKYIYLNTSSGGATPYETMRYINNKFGELNRRSPVKVGISIIYEGFQNEGVRLTELQRQLDTARNLAVPILIQVDVEKWLPMDLVNWWDPSKPGYNPDNINNVEWYGWTPETATKIAWRNWGTRIRILPAPNLASPTYRQRAKETSLKFINVVMDWYKKLPEGEKYLFGGWRVGWETTIGSSEQYYVNGNDYLDKPVSMDPLDGSPTEKLGYNAVKTLGLQNSGTITHGNMIKVLSNYITDLAKFAYDNGVPREKIFNHSVLWGAVDNNQVLVNPYSNPGVTFYPFYPTKNDYTLRDVVRFHEPAKRAMKEFNATGYAIGETNTWANKDYDAWFKFLRANIVADPDLIYLSIYNHDTVMYKENVERAIIDCLNGWPLSPAEETYVLQPEFKPAHAPRRQGGIGGYKPELWPVISSAGYWGADDGNRQWLDTHKELVQYVLENQGSTDILLVGDSLTQQWGGSFGKPFIDPWNKNFGKLKTLNIGIGGDKTQNVLWRLNNGGVQGIDPKVVVLMIGTNNMYNAHETGAAPIAQGIRATVEKIRFKLPDSDIILMDVLPAGKPGEPFHENIKKTNEATKALALDQDPKVHLLRVHDTLLNNDGTLNTTYFGTDLLHLSDAGYTMISDLLKPLILELTNNNDNQAPVKTESAPKKTASPSVVTEVASQSMVTISEKIQEKAPEKAPEKVESASEAPKLTSEETETAVNVSARSPEPDVPVTENDTEQVKTSKSLLYGLISLPLLAVLAIAAYFIRRRVK
jgi:lysophospholipase L1-like esterase